MRIRKGKKEGRGKKGDMEGTSRRRGRGGG
jgi:hypothetical protein